METPDAALVKALYEGNDPEMRWVFYEYAQSSATRYILEHAIRAEVIPANEALVYYASRLVTADDLLSFGIALRNGADPNVYVQDYEVAGARHILAYLLGLQVLHGQHSLREASLIEIAIALLILAGSRKDLPVFQTTDITVERWAREQGFDPRNFLNSSPPLNAMLISGQINRMMTEEEATTIMESRSTSADNIRYFPVPVKTLGIDYELIYTAIVEFDDVAFAHYVSISGGISYALINVLLLRLGRFHDVYPLVEALSNMLVTVIKNGYDLDAYQMAVAADLGADIVRMINLEQSQPQWKRRCGNNPSREIRQAMRAIGVEDVTSEVCPLLERIFLSDPTKLYEALLVKQELYVLSRYGYPFEILDNDRLKIENRDDAYDLAPDYVVFYREGSGKLFAFDSTMYNKIVDTRLNPLTLARVPDHVVDEVALKRDIILAQNRNLSTPQTIRDLVAFIMQSHKSQPASEHPKLAVLPAVELQSIVCAFTCVYLLNELSDEHATLTFEKILDEMLDEALKARLVALHATKAA